MTRQEAKRLGHAFYENGNACRHGHIAPRYTNKGACVVCERARGKKYDPVRRKQLISMQPERYRMLAFKHRRTEKFRARNAAEAAKMRAKGQMRRATPRWADLGEIRKVYNRCAEMQRYSSEKLSVDHIIPLRGRIVCGLHVANNLQIIPLLENKVKNNRFSPTPT